MFYSSISPTANRKSSCIKTNHCSFHQKCVEKLQKCEMKCKISSDLGCISNICNVSLQFYLKWRYWYASFDIDIGNLFQKQ